MRQRRSSEVESSGGEEDRRGDTSMSVSRREFLDFLKATCAASALPNVLFAGIDNKRISAQPKGSIDGTDPVANDIHSQLNATWVRRIIRPESTQDLRRTILAARAERTSISVAGGRHSMGTQQFGTGTTLIDMTAM